MTDVTIIGLGQMGLTLAELMLRAGRTVTLWNRSADRAEGLVARGANLAPDPASAVAASPVTLVCVLDYAAAEAILHRPQVGATLAGRILANLGTGSADDARRAEAFVAGHGGRYLDGAIQAAPSQMGQPDTPILISGERATFAEIEPLLAVLGGNLVYLGEAIEAAAFMDLATLSYVYGAYAGFLHGARIAEVVGIDVRLYGKLVRDIAPSFGAFFAHQGDVIASGDFTVSESPMRISVTAVQRILQASRDLGIDTRVPALVDDWLGQADRAGLGDEELAALVKILRR